MQELFTQVVLPLQAFPQEPQFALSLLVLISQPLTWTPSQFL